MFLKKKLSFDIRCASNCAIDCVFQYFNNIYIYLYKSGVNQLEKFIAREIKDYMLWPVSADG